MSTYTKFFCVGFITLLLSYAQSTTGAERWQLTFHFVGHQVELIDAIRLGDNGRIQAMADAHAGQAQLQLRTRKGILLHSQPLTDPRLVRVPMLPGQSSAHPWVLRDEGSFVVVTDALPNAAELTILWPQLQTSDGVSPALQSRLPLQEFAAQLQLLH